MEFIANALRYPQNPLLLIITGVLMTIMTGQIIINRFRNTRE